MVCSMPQATGFVCYYKRVNKLRWVFMVHIEPIFWNYAHFAPIVDCGSQCRNQSINVGKLKIHQFWLELFQTDYMLIVLIGRIKFNNNIYLIRS